MIQTLFIANRGEIAYRILRSAHKLGMRVALGVSQADINSRAAAEADEVILLGGAASADSYLNIDKVIAAAQQANADAVHPGYGFLAENAHFARAVVEAGLIFVGPSADVIHAMGDKLQARNAAESAGLSVVPGGNAASLEESMALLDKIGFPLLIKAAAGGGGRGMQLVHSMNEFKTKRSLAISEAKAAFGDERVFFERFIAHGRHIEVQVLGDGKRAVHIGSRDCSIQRRYQKLLEEAPAPGIPAEHLNKLQQAAVNLAEHIGYIGAGTVEFLVDANSFEFYFLEMNARIQVEHPVTEMISGIDLIEQQLLIANGSRLGLQQQDINFEGHAIEVRINAEDPALDFRPSPGLIQRACWPAGHGIRVDTHIRSTDMVTSHYDSLIGKIIVHADNRQAAISKMQRALKSASIEGVATTLSLHQAILTESSFIEGGISTRFFEEFYNGQH